MHYIPEKDVAREWMLSLKFILSWLRISFCCELKVIHNVFKMGSINTRILLQLELDNFEVS
jgi:hypothetical protein